MDILDTLLKIINSLAAVVAASGIVFAARQIRFNCWLKAQEIFTDKDFVKARKKVYSRLPDEHQNANKNWTEEDFFVCRKMDELARLAPYFRFFLSGKKLILEKWKDPFGKSWKVLHPLIEEEQKKWSKKWKAFDDIGKEAAKQLEL